jgi:hypothetical protein
MAGTNQNEILSSFMVDDTKRVSDENVYGSLGDETFGQSDRRKLFKVIYAAGCQPEKILLNFVTVKASRQQENARHFVFI